VLHFTIELAKVIFIILQFFFICTTLVHAEFYKYIDKNGEIHFTDNILSVPENNRGQIKTYKEATSTTRSDSAPTAKYSDQLNLSASDKCYLKMFGRIFSGNVLTDYNAIGLTRDKFDQLKIEMQKRYGVNDETICASLTPDARFSSPDSTWALYKEALIKADIKQAMECFSLESVARYRAVFAALGKEKMKRMGLDMQPVQKITQSSTSAKYRIRRNEREQEITYYIYFGNEFENWKIQQF